MDSPDAERLLDEDARRLVLDSGHRVSVSSVWRQTQNLPEELELLGRLKGYLEQPHPAVSRYNYASVGGVGTYLQMRLEDELVIGLINAVYPRPGRVNYWADEPLLMLRAALAAGTAYTVPGLPTMVFNRPEVVIAYVPKGTEIHIDIYPGVRQQGVVLLMNAEQFLRRFELVADDLPQPLRGVFDGTAPVGRVVTLPLDEKLAQLVESMTQGLKNLALHRLAVSGALRELVANVLDAADRSTEFAGRTGLRPRDHDLAYRARDWLDKHATSPRKFAELAKELGTNQKALKVVFRRVFGTTMADYCVEKRMRMAQRLLLEGRLTVSQVADRVGYEHLSSFSAAFSAHAGMPPREYQRHRPALDVSLGPPTSPDKPGMGRSA